MRNRGKPTSENSDVGQSEVSRSLPLLRALLLLLLLVAHLLQLLEHLLRGAVSAVGVVRRTGTGGRVGVRRRWRIVLILRLLRRLLFVLSPYGTIRVGGALGERRAARGEADLAGGSRSGAAEHDDVISTAVEELGDDLAGLAGAVGSEDALVLVQTFKGHARRGADLIHDGGKARVVGLYGELAISDFDFGRLCGLVEK